MFQDYRNMFRDHGWSVIGGLPGLGWSSQPGPVPAGPHTRTGYLFNSGTEPFTVTSMSWVWDGMWRSAEEQTRFRGGTPLGGIGHLTLGPGEFVPVELTVPYDAASGSYIFARGNVGFEGSEGPATSEVFFGVEEEFATATSVEGDPDDSKSWGGVKAIFH